MLILALLTNGCLINEAVYLRRLAELTDSDGDGFAAEDDCDDGNIAVNPEAQESCEGVDEDCDGEVDDDAEDVASWFADNDGDGHGDAASREWACDAPHGFVASEDDCDDGDAAVFPGATEIPYNGIDDDCSAGDADDLDGDGQAGTAAGGADCDDDDPASPAPRTAEAGWDGGRPVATGMGARRALAGHSQGDRHDQISVSDVSWSGSRRRRGSLRGEFERVAGCAGHHDVERQIPRRIAADALK